MYPKDVLGPISFNLYLNDLFYLADFAEVCNFEDDATFYARTILSITRTIINDIYKDDLK